MSAKTLLLIGIFCAVIAYVMVMDRGNQRVIATLPAWKLDSETGTINADQTEMTLFENVTVVQQPTEELELQTEQLDINLVDQTASSAEKVVIMHTSGRQEGVGMTAELKRNELRLLSQVKGNYAQPQ